MSAFTTNLSEQSRVVLRPLAILWSFLVSVGEASSRAGEIRTYADMTDEQLSKLGIDRSRIVEHVFRDRITF